MSKRGNKLFFFVTAAVLIVGCDNYKDKMCAKKSTNEYVQDHFSEYQPIYTLITDSIHFYVDSLISSYLKEYYTEWHVDSLLCINSEGNKLVTTINESSGNDPKVQSDQIEKLLGKKINGQWYFFKAGETLAIIRENYGRSGTDPLSFYELSQIARREFLEGALIEQADGSYKVNDGFIDYHFYNGYHTGKTKEGKDSVHWVLIRGQWNHRIDTNEYKPMRKHKFNM